MRIFIAIELPKDILKKILDAQSKLKELGLIASFPKEDNIHITLIFLGERSEGEINEIKSRLNSFSFKKFKISVKSIGTFPNDNRINILWVGAFSERLKELYKLICFSINYEPERDFKGHITLARIKTGKNINHLKEFIKNNKEIEFGEFEVKEFVLKKSVLTKDGAIYGDIEKFKLD